MLSRCLPAGRPACPLIPACLPARPCCLLPAAHLPARAAFCLPTSLRCLLPACLPAASLTAFRLPACLQIEIISNLAADAVITLYRVGPMVDLCSGPHVPNSGILKVSHKSQLSVPC